MGYAYAQLASDEITEEHACQQFGLQESQMAKLHARRLSREETCQLISRWRRERVYKVRPDWQSHSTLQLCEPPTETVAW